MTPQGQKASKLQELMHELTVGDVMTRDVITVRSTVPMSQLRRLLSVNRISGLPVVDGTRLQGIVSVEDYINCLADREYGCTIGEMMTRDVETLYADDPLTLAIAASSTMLACR